MQRIDRLMVALLLLVPLAGCEETHEPSRSAELAAQGVFGGRISSEYTLVGSLNHGISLWRNRDVERLYNWSHSAGEFAELVAGSFSPDERRAVTTDPRTLVLWDTETGAALQYWATPAAVLDVAMLSDGRRALLAMDDHSALLFDAEDGSYLATLLHEGRVESVAVSADDQLAITGSEDEYARIWRLPDGGRGAELHLDNPVRVVALSADGSKAFSAAQGRWVGLWNPQTSAKLHTLTERNTGVTSAAFNGDGSRLLVGYVNREVELWDTRSGRRLKLWRSGSFSPWRNNGSAVVAVGFAAAGTGSGPGYLALTGDGRLLKLR